MKRKKTITNFVSQFCLTYLGFSFYASIPQTSPTFDHYLGGSVEALRGKLAKIGVHTL